MAKFHKSRHIKSCKRPQNKVLPQPQPTISRVALK